MHKTKLLVGLTVLYLSLPVLFFVSGWLRQSIAVILAIIQLSFFIVVFLDLMPSFSYVYSGYSISGNKLIRHFLLIEAGVIFVVIAVWLLGSGIGGFGYQTTDYLASNALFKDLIDLPWPLTMTWSGETVPVVYYVGWYLPAAFAGKLLGWAFANIFLLLWAFVGVILSFGWFLNLCAVRNITLKKILLILSIFCLAGGLDFLGYYVLRGHPFDIYNLVPLDGWSFLQYSSNTTLLYWVPQHTIPAWLITGLVVNCIYDDFPNVKYLGMSLAGCLISSPFGVLGVIPYLFVLLAMVWQKKQLRQFFAWKSLILNISAVPVSVAIFFYLSSNKFNFPVGFLWEFTDSSLIFAGWLEFFLMEIGFLSMFVLAGMWLDRSASFQRARFTQKDTFEVYLKNRHGINNLHFSLFVISVSILFLLPAYKMGYAGDFVMRGSIPSLFIFWSFISKILTDSSFGKVTGFRVSYVVIVCLAIIGFYNSLAQISVTIVDYHFGAPDEHSVLTVATGSLPWVVEQRIGDGDAFFYRYLGK